MMRDYKLAVLLIASLLVANPLSAKEKQRDWQTGKLISAESMDAGTIAVPIAGVVVAKDLRAWVYTIETDSMTYELVWRFGAPLNLTVNSTIKFAIEKKNKAFVIDDEGKERQLSVYRKTAKNEQ